MEYSLMHKNVLVADLDLDNETGHILKIIKIFNVQHFPVGIVDKNGIEGVYEMDTLNTIYAVFEDRKVKYDKERFLSRHFKKEKPIYDVVLGR